MKQIEEMKKKLMKVKLFLMVVPIVILILFFVVLLVVIVSPILGFMDGTFDTTDRTKNTFINTILDREEYWNEKGVQIDKELILSVLLYGRAYDYDGDYELENCDLEDIDSCITSSIKKEDNKKMIKYAKELADGMVKEQTIWSCRNQKEVTKVICDDEKAFLPKNTFEPYSYLLRLEIDIPSGDGGSGPCHTETQTVYTEWNTCGYDDRSLCDYTCDAGYETSSEKVYNIKTKEEFTAWLKETGTDEFGDKGYNLAEKLKDVDIEITGSEEEREKKLDETIESIYNIYVLARNTDGDSYFMNIGDPYDGDYTKWKQGNPAWANHPLGTTPRSTIGNYGCLATSLAVQIARSGTYIDMGFLGADNFNPGTFIGRIRQHGAFTAGGSYIWNNQGIAQLAPNFRYRGQEKLTGSWSNKLSQIYSHLEQGHYLILAVKDYGHWVAVTGISDGNIMIVDPGGHNYTSVLPGYAQSGVVGIAIFEKTD